MWSVSEGRNLRLTSTHPIANTHTHTQVEGKVGRGGREKERKKDWEGERKRDGEMHTYKILNITNLSS